VNNVGILLRGKSLTRVKSIHKTFNCCYIVNDFKKEIRKVEPYIKGKEIIHVVNSMDDAGLRRVDYKDFNIKKMVFAFTREMYKRSRPIERHYKKMGVPNHEYFPDSYTERLLQTRNTGLNSILYVSDIIRPKNIWIVGLEFYQEDYLVKKNSKHHSKKAKKIKMIETFLDIVREHPNISYYMITYCKELPNDINNLHITEA